MNDWIENERELATVLAALRHWRLDGSEPNYPSEPVSDHPGTPG